MPAGGGPITQRDQSGADAAPAGVVLLFAPSRRPTGDAIRALADIGGFSVTHDAASAEAVGAGEPPWLELLLNGLTFDLAGLAGGPAAAAWPPCHLFGLAADEREGLEAVSLVAGPHLAGGAAMLPVVRSQLALAHKLCALAGLVAVGWGPARSWMSAAHFTATIGAWLEGGPFPALGLTAVVPAPDGGLRSEGLAFFTGQELAVAPELARDRVGATRLAVRLIDQLVTHGALGEPLAFAGPEGEPLVIAPSADGRLAQVRSAG